MQEKLRLIFVSLRCNAVIADRRNFVRIFINIVEFLSTLIDLCSYHVAYAFQSESTLYSCRNVKELLARNRREI